MRCYASLRPQLKLISGHSAGASTMSNQMRKMAKAKSQSQLWSVVFKTLFRLPTRTCSFSRVTIALLYFRLQTYIANLSVVTYKRLRVSSSRYRLLLRLCSRRRQLLCRSALHKPKPGPSTCLPSPFLLQGDLYHRCHHHHSSIDGRLNTRYDDLYPR